MTRQRERYSKGLTITLWSKTKKQRDNLHLTTWMTVTSTDHHYNKYTHYHHLHVKNMKRTEIVLTHVDVSSASLFTLNEQSTCNNTWHIRVCDTHNNSKIHLYQQDVLSIQRCPSILLTHSTNSDSPFPPLLPSPWAWAHTNLDGTTMTACEPETNWVSSNWKGTTEPIHVIKEVRERWWTISLTSSGSDIQ